MKAINEFISQFTDKKIEGITKVGRRYYLANEDLLKLDQKLNRDSYSIGLYLGEFKGRLQPTPVLIDLISKISSQKIVISKKAEWLFLCGRDVFEDNIVKKQTHKDLVLVQNQLGENLGYGKIMKKGKSLERGLCLN